MDSEHAFSAFIVLLMVCAAFPSDQRNTASLKAAIELLECMWACGNDRVRTRYMALQPVVAEVTRSFAPASIGMRGAGDETLDGSMTDLSWLENQNAPEYNAPTRQNHLLSHPAPEDLEMWMGLFLENTNGEDDALADMEIMEPWIGWGPGEQ
jgi:hypothetical protein